jgi:membrane protein
LSASIHLIILLQLTSIKKTKVQRFQHYFGVLKEALISYIKEGAFFHGATLAYYTLFALVPILYLSISTFGRVVGYDKMMVIIQEFFKQKIGISDTESILSYIKTMQVDQESWFFEVISIFILLYTCSAFLVSLRRSLNEFFNVKNKENQNIILSLLRFRFLSVFFIAAFALIIILFYFFQIFIVSLLEHWIVSTNGFVDIGLSVLNHLLTIFSNVLILWLIFKYVNDAKISSILAFKGAVLTAILLYSSQLVIKFYLQHYFFLGKSGIAGSLFILLAWVNYSSQIVFFGAKFTYLTSIKK